MPIGVGFRVGTGIAVGGKVAIRVHVTGGDGSGHVTRQSLISQLTSQ